MTFKDELRDFINLSHAYAWHCAAGGKPDEPGLVSALIAPVMIKELKRIIAKNEPKFASDPLPPLLNGIFTHKTPLVQPKKETRAVEIADLMLVRQHWNTASGKVIRTGRAVLLQAKRNSVPTSGDVSTGNPRIQYNLYANWPEFEGRRRLRQFAISPDPWNFPSLDSDCYGKYIAIFDGDAFDYPASSGYPSWTGAPTGKFTPAVGAYTSGTSWGLGDINPTYASPSGVPCRQDFAEVLELFIRGGYGASFTPGGTSDHWSIFVNEMLLTAAEPGYTYLSKRTGITTPQSRNGRISFESALTMLGLLHHDIGLSPWLQSFFSRESDHLDELKRYSSILHLLQEHADHSRIASSGRGSNRDDPPDRLVDSPEDFGHPAILSLITFGPETPEFLYDDRS